MSITITAHASPTPFVQPQELEEQSQTIHSLIETLLNLESPIIPVSQQAALQDIYEEFQTIDPGIKDDTILIFYFIYHVIYPSFTDCLTEEIEIQLLDYEDRAKKMLQKMLDASDVEADRYLQDLLQEEEDYHRLVQEQNMIDKLLVEIYEAAEKVNNAMKEELKSAIQEPMITLSSEIENSMNAIKQQITDLKKQAESVSNNSNELTHEISGVEARFIEVQHALQQILYPFSK